MDQLTLSDGTIGEKPADLSSLPIVQNQDVDTLTIMNSFIDRGESGALFGPFRWIEKKCVLKQIMVSSDRISKGLEQIMSVSTILSQKLEHKNVLKLFEVRVHCSVLYIVMEYAEGKSLDKILRPRDAKPPPYPHYPLDGIRDWALQIADGMEYLHSKEIVHGDLKSAHVLVMESPDVVPNKLKIGSYSQIPKTNMSLLPGFIYSKAPEHICGKPFDKLSDVWSYGIILLEILTRELPYKEMRKETDIVKAAARKTLMPTIPGSCPQPLKDLLAKCLKIEEEKRPKFTQICAYIRSREIW